MTTSVTIKNVAAPHYSDGKPNLHVVKVKVYSGGGSYPQEAELGPGESLTTYVYPGQEVVLSEDKVKEKTDDKVSDDGYDWRPSDV